MRNHTGRPVDFLHHRAWIRRDLHAQHEPVFGSPDHRLAEINRIIGDRDPRQIIAAAVPILRQRSLIAGGHAVAPVIIFLEVRGCDLERIAFPHCGGESSPGVRRVLRRTRAAIHVIGIVDRAQPFGVPRHDFPRNGVHFFRNAHLRGAARDVHGAMRPALPFGQCVQRRVPGFSPEQAGVAHRDSEELADVRISDIIFVRVRSPVARKIRLRQARQSHQPRDQAEPRTRSHIDSKPFASLPLTGRVCQGLICHGGEAARYSELWLRATNRSRETRRARRYRASRCTPNTSRCDPDLRR